MDVSPYLSAIQALKGETPGEKYQDLHSVAIKIIESKEEKNNFLENGTTTRVLPGLHPTLRILVGLKLKSKDAVIEALKSDDVTIIKLALGAKWFFNASNDLVNIDYLSEKLLPFVSVRTRLDIIKVLSRFLQDKQAESFHRYFAELFGSDQALSLLMSCGEDYIYDEILKNKMLLSDRILKQLYRNYPQLVVRYFRFIKDGKAEKWNIDGRSVGLKKYVRFLPNLAKNHTQEFIELCQSIEVDYRFLMKMGRTRAEYFLNNAAEAVVENPEDFLKMLPLKSLKKKLNEQQYNTMLQNMFPKDIEKLYPSHIIEYIENYYPKEGGFELFNENYKKAYNKEVIDHDDFFDNEWVYKILPPELKTECLRKLVNAFVDKSEYWKNVYKLPPKEAIPLLKEQINKSSFISREDSLRQMLKTCCLYDSKEDLLEVLQYYNSRHKNEQPSVTLSWLEGLTYNFILCKNDNLLEKEHWQIIKDITQRAFIKANTRDWQNAHNLQFRILRYLLKQRVNGESEERDKVIVDSILSVMFENYFDKIKDKRNFVDFLQDHKEIFLENVLSVVHKNYPETHAVWKKNNNKLIFTTDMIRSMAEVNEKKSQAPSDPSIKAIRMLIQNYPLLTKFTTELFVNKEKYNKSNDYTHFYKCLRKYFPDYCQNLIDEHSDMINDVSTDDALRLLKHDRNKVLAKLDAYVAGCRSNLVKSKKSIKWFERDRRSARHFVMALKWHQDIPVKFVEKCLAEIEEKGSMLILGILLEGEVLSKIIEPYLPKETKLEIDSENAKKEYDLARSIPKAFIYTNPSPPLQVLLQFCRREYSSVASSALSSIAQRLPIDQVLSFCNQLTTNKIAVKKASFRLICQVSSKPESRKFLAKICKEEKNSGVREAVGKMVYKVFTQTPNPDSWQLMKEFIQDLLPDDKKIYVILKKVRSVSVDYLADYLLEIFNKINSFSDEELNEKEKSSLILSILEECGDKHAFNNMPENVISEIVKKCFLECSVDFIFDIYLFYNEQKFEDRLKIFTEIITDNLMRLDEVDSKKRRYHPMIRKIHEKIASKDVFANLERNENKNLKLAFTASILNIDALQKYLHCFIILNIYDIYLKSIGPDDFGKQCGENIDNLIKIYNNEIIIDHYGHQLKSFAQCLPEKNRDFDVINGLKSYNFKYGVLIGLKLLRKWGVGDYDERYDQFIETAKNSDDITVQAFVNKFLRQIY